MRGGGSRPVRAVVSGTVTDAPIGIFDSGVGGLTVARAVLDQLPHEPVLYVGDTARGPYGPRPIPEVRAFALDVMDHLVDQGVKMLVIACNSASAAVLRDARERYDVPVVEVIQPAVRRAVRVTRNGRVARHRHARHGHERRLRRRVRRGSRHHARAAGLPALRRVRRGRGHRRRRAAGGRARVPRPGRRARRRHRGPRLHPLPAARGRHLLRRRRGRHAREQRRRDGARTSTARSSRTASSATPRCPRRCTASWPPGDPAPFTALARRFLGPEVVAVEHATEVIA